MGGCFGNCGVCIISYLAPCIQVGKVAEALGDNFCCYCMLFFVPVVDLLIVCNQRGRIREHQGIEGSPIMDALLTVFCPFCVIAQMGNEATQIAGGQALSMARE